MKKALKPIVFWPPFILLLAAVLLSFFNKDIFTQTMNTTNQWILLNFDWLFAWGGFLFLVTSLIAYFSPLGNVRIGGENAKPILNRWRWFSITLCTTIAIGILFWASAEPLFHIHSPPEALGIAPNSPEAQTFAMSTLYMHWSFIPYAIYTVPAIMFALVYYNQKKSYSLSSSLTPIFGKIEGSKLAQIIDAICLFSLVAGMAAALGAGALSMVGGTDYLFGFAKSSLSLGIVIGLVVIAFLMSASSGLMQGIRILSSWNIRIFFTFAAIILILGPTLDILKLGFFSFGEFIGNFFERSIITGDLVGTDWSNSWTIFYWANWLAWAPITALFLGRIAYGYRVKDFIVMNLFLPALFGCAWMTIFGGTSILLDTQQNGFLYNALNEQGAGYVMYNIFNQYPLSFLLAIFFLLTAFISFVTASDSNTEAMAGISSTGITPKSPEPPNSIKIIWGLIIGLVSWVMVSYAGIDGVKMLSNFGGFPALILILLINVALLKTIFQHIKPVKKSLNLKKQTSSMKNGA